MDLAAPPCKVTEARIQRYAKAGKEPPRPRPAWPPWSPPGPSRPAQMTRPGGASWSETPRCTRGMATGKPSPAFVEWVVGFTRRWTDVPGVSREQRLQMLGSAVVTAVAALAWLEVTAAVAPEAG